MAALQPLQGVAPQVEVGDVGPEVDQEGNEGRVLRNPSPGHMGLLKGFSNLSLSGFTVY